ncbi:putative phage abortive infection protein [uncultured Zobellia sp.]|uniref:putative phage abortive infection protein n=1 Tax=uncultured Zobellia sp. TaxID=255433 RepID=UPI002595FBBF|nr:putative phage abortive infection protein [uncultured Zobellia sp.]
MTTKKKKDNIIGLYTLFIVIFVAWITSMLVLKWKFSNWTIRGTFGDSFGAINSLFSGLALGGIIYTIFLQKKELTLQRKELKNTRKEFTIQNKTLRLQRFENTFFNLLSLHHQILDSIDFDIQRKKMMDGGIKTLSRAIENGFEYETITLKGRDVFKERYEKMLSEFDNEEDLNSNYLKFYESVQTDFGHYFRNLYRIIKLVDETEFHTHIELGTSPNDTKYIDLISYSSPNHDTRYRYTSMIRAQLSDYELLWLFYNCLSENGIEKFKPYIEKYSLLKNIPKDKLHNNKVADQYIDSAYENK